MVHPGRDGASINYLKDAELMDPVISPSKS